VTVINDYALNYLLEIPAEVPTGRVVVHTHARSLRSAADERRLRLRSEMGR
jgi:hypothetical protein